MTLKPKKWIWKLTFPFAHNNYTSIGNTIYYPRGYLPNKSVIKHEYVHVKQRERVGAFWFYFAYLFLLPFFWNPWRYEWEYEAYKTSGLSDEAIHEILSSYRYGWLR